MLDSKAQKKGRRIRNPPSMLIYSRLICLPVRSPRGHRGACGVAPLSMDSSIASMTAMRVHAHHAERQVRQPGLVPLPRAIQEYHEKPDISIPFPSLSPFLVSHNGAESGYAGREVDTGGRQVESDGERVGQTDTDDGDDKSGWRDDGASRIDGPSGKQSIRNARQIRIVRDSCIP